MLDGEFTRGTTPTHIYRLPENLYMEDIADISIAYRQKNKTVLIKYLADCHFFKELDNRTQLALVLSQEDTLLFDPNIKIVEVQLKAKTVGSDVIPIGEHRFRLKDCYDTKVFDLRN